MLIQRIHILFGRGFFGEKSLPDRQASGYAGYKYETKGKGGILP